MPAAALQVAVLELPEEDQERREEARKAVAAQQNAPAEVAEARPGVPAAADGTGPQAAEAAQKDPADPGPFPCPRVADRFRTACRRAWRRRCWVHRAA